MSRIFGILLMGCLALQAAQITRGADPVDAQRALQSLPANSWYDKQTKQYLPPKVPQEVDNPLRSSGWKAKEKPPQPTNNSAPWNWGNFNVAAALGQVLPPVIFSLMAVLLVSVIALLTYYAFRNYMPVRFKRKSSTQAIDVDMTRVVDLPFEVTSTQNNPLAEAERLMQLGRYNEALVSLYGYQLLALDQARRIHLQKGKTNRMYLRELRSYLGLRDMLEETMLAFEAFYFGKHPVEREQFMKVWQQVDEFHALLNATASVVPKKVINPAAIA